MITETFGHLAALLGCLFIPGWVFLRNPRHPAHRGFALLGLSGLIYNGAALLASRAAGAARLGHMQTAYLGAFLLLPVMVRFPRAFLGPELVPPRPRLEPLSWVGAALFATLACAGVFLTGLDPRGQAQGGVALGAWTLVIGLAFVDFSRVLLAAYRRRPSPALRNRLAYLVLGAAAFGVPAASDLAYRLGLDLGQPFPLAPLGSLGFLGCLAVAIVRHRLLDIEVVLHRGLVLTVLTPAIATSFVVLGEALEGLFAGTLPPDSPYPNILAALFVSAGFGPLSAAISALIERFVIREFKVAPGLRRFRELPVIIGAEDAAALRELQRELGVIADRIEAKRAAADGSPALSAAAPGAPAAGPPGPPDPG